MTNRAHSSGQQPVGQLPLALVNRESNLEPDKQTMQFSQLDHVALHVKDVDESCRFYSEVMMLESIPRPAFDFPGAWFRLGKTQELHLIGDRDEPVVSGNRGNHFAVLTDDLDVCEAHLLKKQAKIIRKNIRPDGAGQIFVADPDGHIMELCTAPPQ